MSEAADGSGRARRRALRTGGLIACLAGTLVMVSGRFTAGAPVWLIYAGLSGIVFGWGLFAAAVMRRSSAPHGPTENMKS